MADAADSKSAVEIRVGSSPISFIKKHRLAWSRCFFYVQYSSNLGMDQAARCAHTYMPRRARLSAANCARHVTKLVRDLDK